MKEQNYILLKKLDKFIRKYYKNQLIKGGIYCFTLIIVFFLLVNLVEYFGRFDPMFRTIIFFIYIFLNLLIIVKYILIPLVKIFKIGNVISNEEAAVIIGKHFSNVSDKLLNTLQLQKKVSDHINNDLVYASIDQKIKELKPIPFQSAINFNINSKYLKFLIVPLSVLIIVFLTSPKIITEPSSRLIHYSNHYELEMPFYLKVVNDKLEVVQHDDFILRVKVVGEKLPEQVYIKLDNTKIKLSKESQAQYSYTFINVQKDFSFQVLADRFLSEKYKITVLPKPIILDFEVDIDYPGYTQKKDEKFINIGDHIIPEGTKVSWHFFTENTDNIQLHFDSIIELTQNTSNKFTWSNKFYKDYIYYVSSSNMYLKNSDSLSYTLRVIPDLYPQIIVEEFKDSVFNNRLYFRGSIKDDYGFSNLKFIVTSSGEHLKVIDTLQINKALNLQEYFYYFDLATLNLSSGNNVEYYFEVWDNDNINGIKSTKSQIMTFRLPTINEINEEKEQTNKQLKDELEETIKDVKELQEEIEKINKKLVDKKNLSWEDREQIKELLEKQSDLEEKLKNIQQQNEEKSLKEQQYKEVNEEILNKQKQLEELFKQLTENEELKKLFEELKKLIDEVDKENVDKMLEDMKLSNEELEKALDRNLELFKQLEFEQKLEETIEKLNKLSQEQEELSDKTSDKKNDLDEIKPEQEKISNEFNELQKDIEELDKLNEELEEKNEFNKMEEAQEDINDELNQSQENLDDNKRKKASESQKNSSEKMGKMAQSMLQMQQDMIQEGMAEDMDALRSILENLIQLSFDQENLIHEVSEININDPQYTGLIQEQKNIQDDLKIVEDSLFALSKRQIMIQPFVNKEVSSVNQNISESIDLLTNRRTNQAASKQQYAMTSINNLALMLSETLNQMMQMMALPGSGTCKSSMPKPGSGKSSMKSMRQLQEQLNKQIEQMKSGKQKGGKEKNGQKSEQGQSMSEQLARSAAEQEYIRNQLRSMSEQLEKEGEFGSSKELKRIMKDMEQTETDIVNRMITQETLQRQKQILTRLLKSEKAEMEREKEEKRESIESKNKYSRNPEIIFKYKKVQNNEVELLRTVPPALQPFYKNKVNQYFFNFDELLEQ